MLSEKVQAIISKAKNYAASYGSTSLHLLFLVVAVCEDEDARALLSLSTSKNNRDLAHACLFFCRPRLSGEHLPLTQDVEFLLEHAESLASSLLESDAPGVVDIQDLACAMASSDKVCIMLQTAMLHLDDAQKMLRQWSGKDVKTIREQELMKSLGKLLKHEDPSRDVGGNANQEYGASHWVPGQRLPGNLVVEQTLGEGGIGKGYLVRCQSSGCRFEVERARGFKEADRKNLVAGLQAWIDLPRHGNLVPCYCFRHAGDEVLIFIEYMEGASLREWIDSRQLYEGGAQDVLKRILGIAIQTAHGLHFAHERGVVHENVKPSNVRILPDGTAKMTDFIPGAGLVTPAYASPEQANHQPLSRKTDIWSWALMVLEMFIGDEVCWATGSDAPEVLKHLPEHRLEPGQLPQLPKDLERLLESCFALDVDKRPPTALAIVEALTALCQTLIGPACDHQGPQSPGLQSGGLCVDVQSIDTRVSAETSSNTTLACTSAPTVLKSNASVPVKEADRWVLQEILGKGRSEQNADRPQTIRGYTIERQLGRGGLGLVYLARHENSGQLVALKLMPSRVKTDERAKQCFLSSVGIIAALKHRNIVEFRESGCFGTTFFFALEYCSQGSVAELMKKSGGKLPVKEAMPVICDVLDGLEYAHHSKTFNVKLKDGSYAEVGGLIHHDLSPPKILLTEIQSTTVAKVSNFGLRRAFDRAGLTGMVQSGGVARKPWFMSRKDVWQVVIETEAVPIRRRNAEIPARLAEVIDKALIDRPAILFKTAADLKLALLAAI